MAYSKNPNNYPPEFAELFRRALADKDGCEVECEDFQQATSLRHQLHGYRRAVEAIQLEGWSDLRQVTIQIRGKSTVVLANNAKLLATMREAAKMTAPTEEQLDRYLEQLEKENGQT